MRWWLLWALRPRFVLSWQLQNKSKSLSDEKLWSKWGVRPNFLTWTPVHSCFDSYCKCHSFPLQCLQCN
jgi:hypothetical protein